MKTISIGDIHGSLLWKDVDIDNYDKVIFSGDYVDDWPPTPDIQIYNNLLDIIRLKEDNPEKVELLLGNHDLQYMFIRSSQHSCSGFRKSMALKLNILFKDQRHLFKAAHHEIDQYGKLYLWTHAGVTERWYVENLVPFIEKHDLKMLNLEDQLNAAFRNYEGFMFDVGYTRGGLHPSGGPFWADATELNADILSNVNQIVGHTKVKEIRTNEIAERGASMTLIDRLHDAPDFYELNL